MSNHHLLFWKNSFFRQGILQNKAKVSLWCSWLVLVLGVGCFAWFLFSHFAPSITGPDANGYWAQGTLLAKTGRTTFVPESPLQYIGIHWLRLPDGSFVSRYPPGLAVAIASLSLVIPEEWTTLLNPFLALASIVLLFLIGDYFLSPWWALVPPLFLMISPTFFRHALICDAHMATLFLLLLQTYFLLQWQSSRRWLSLFLAFLVFACIPAVRYPEFLFILPLVGFVIFSPSHRKEWKKIVLLIIPGSIPFFLLLLRNHLVFGKFWQTGYALTNEQTGFSWDNFVQHIPIYLSHLQGSGPGSLTLIGLICAWVFALSPPQPEEKHRQWGIYTLLIIIPVTLLYFAYYWAPETRATGTLRFLLPLFPFYFLLSTQLFAWILKDKPFLIKFTLFLVIFLFQMGWTFPELKREAKTISGPRQVLAVTTEYLKREIPDGSIILADGWLLQHLDFIRRWRIGELSLLMDLPGIQERNRLPQRMDRRGGSRQNPDAPSPMQREKLTDLRARYTQSSSEEKELLILEDLIAWSHHQPVYIILTGSQWSSLRSNSLLNNQTLKVVLKIPLPQLSIQEEQKASIIPGGPQMPFNFLTRRGGGGGFLLRGFPSGEKELIVARWFCPPEYDPDYQFLQTILGNIPSF